MVVECRLTRHLYIELAPVEVTAFIGGSSSNPFTERSRFKQKPKSLVPHSNQDEHGRSREFSVPIAMPINP